MSRELNGDAVSATPHYNVDLDLPEPIDLIRSVPFNVGNFYKYLARSGHKDATSQEMSKALWYATDIAVQLHANLMEIGRPFTKQAAALLDTNTQVELTKLDARLTAWESATSLTSKMKAMNTALKVLRAYETVAASPPESVVRYLTLQLTVLGGLREMVIHLYGADAELHANANVAHYGLKPLSQVYLGTRGQSIHPDFFGDVFPDDRLITHGET